MSDVPILTKEIAILLLLLVACLGAVSFKRLNFPYTVGLVIVGLLLGFLDYTGSPLESLRALTLSHNVILYIFVPPLIFESALKLDNKLLLQTLIPSLTLAGPGLLIATSIIGFFLSWVTPLSLGQALLFGALISATDPVATIALFKELGVPRRLTMFVEGESMLNDATAIVLFDLILVAIANGEFGAATVEKASLDILTTLFGGIVVGVVVATIMRWAIAVAADDYAIQTTVSVVIAYTAFLTAEHYLEFSGVIAVLSAGLMVGRYGEYHLKPAVRKYLYEFWEYAAFIANSLIFLLVGLTTTGFLGKLDGGHPTLWISIGWAIAIAIIVRGAIVFSLIPLVNLFQKSAPIHWRFQLVSFWGGLRGAIALALALSLSSDFANQELIISMTLGVVLFTILVEGSTTSQLVRWLGLDRLSIREELAQSQARVFATKEVIQLLGKLGNQQRLLSPSILNNFKKEYQQAYQQAEKSLETFWENLRKQPIQMRQLFWLQALQIEHHAYRELHDEGLISGLVLKKLSLMMNWKGDGVLSNQIPPRVAKTKMLENVWEKFLLNRLLVWIPKRYWLQKHRLHELTIRYEYYAAIAYVSEKVVQTIRQLAREEAVDDTIASECIDFYQKHGEAAFEWIESFVQERPELALPMQQQVIKRAVSLRETETIEYLANKGIIPESSVDKIRQQIVSS